MSEDFETRERRLAWVKELTETWRYFNRTYLGGILKRPSVHISDADSYLGSWDKASRIIRISSAHILRDPWLGVLDTLRHEMAHQFVDEIMQGRDTAPHGPTFQMACRKLRVSSRASGRGCEVTEMVSSDDPAEASIRKRVEKLFALGTSPNENEARLAIQKARELILRHNLSLAQEPGQRRFAMRSVGAFRRRRQRYEYSLGMILREYFFVETLWMFDFDAEKLVSGSRLTLHGTPSNLDMAEHVFDYVSGHLPRLWLEYKRERGIVSNRGRMDYFWGAVEGFREKLSEQSKRLESERGLVWVGDPELKAFWRHIHPQTRSVSRGSKEVGSEFDDGRADGRSIQIRPPVSAPTRRGNLLE